MKLFSFLQRLIEGELEDNNESKKGEIFSVTLLLTTEY
jgi:hypothetical protein